MRLRARVICIYSYLLYSYLLISCYLKLLWPCMRS
nr:MAG TPA: hypothetical protein [Caudoviricetes sp.]